MSQRNFSEAKAVLFSGNRKGGSAIRSRRDGAAWKPTRFETYAARAFASIQGLEDVLASRTIVIQMRRASNTQILHQGSPSADPRVQQIRDELFLAAMSTAQRIASLYETMAKPTEIRFSGRDYDMVKPILAIGYVTKDEGIVADLISFSNLSYERRMAEFDESSAEHIVLGYLLETIPEDGEYRGDELLQGLKDFISTNDLEYPGQLTPKKQGEMLVRLGIVDQGTKKRSSDKSTRLYFISRAKLEEVARSYGLGPTD